MLPYFKAYISRLERWYESRNSDTLESMQLHVLGCGDAFGSGGRNQSGYLIVTRSCQFLIDCGPTSLLALRRAGFDPTVLDAVLLSHLHGDHFGGLPFFFAYYRYEKPRITPLQIAGPPETARKVFQLDQIMYGSGAAPRRPGSRPSR